MARKLSELSEFSFALSHSFCRGTTFWRDTATKIVSSPCLPRAEVLGSVTEDIKDEQTL